MAVNSGSGKERDNRNNRDYRNNRSSRYNREARNFRSHANHSRGRSMGDRTSKAIINEVEELSPEAKLEGRNSVVEALDAGREFNKVWYLKPQAGKRMDSRLAEIVSRIKDTDAVLYPVDRKTLDRMADTFAHQGIIAQVAPHNYASVDDILARAEEREENAFILILDQIQDSQNLGAIMRTADATGVHGIIIPKRRSVSLDAAAAKTSAGAIEYVPVARVNSINQTISELKDKNIWVACLDMPGDNIFGSEHLRENIALVIGNEGNGISNAVRRSCDFVFELPMRGEINSLNASNAAAVAMYAVLNERL